ncbi:hypothetical protein [Humisphaera borealis]|uniref:Uncharacterized protein n=1 Tax=Humisphaera borealis TaxID=2807512 RepID=A0A7M2X227_9BACT|nr:hypothetical protein [Humisphaera borealis]QOV91826.1 hypothetical protein IPV69_10920 [Humisphaera borealis]
MSTPRVSLEQLRIETPCPASWDAMTGDNRSRFCQACQLQVHDLTAMPREEAERLVCEAAGRLCVRMAVQMTATPIATSPVGYQSSLRTRPRKGWRFWTGIGLIGAGMSAIANAWQGRQVVPVPAPAVVTPVRIMAPMMGIVCPPPASRPSTGSPATSPSDALSSPVTVPDLTAAATDAAPTR